MAGFAARRSKNAGIRPSALEGGLLFNYHLRSNIRSPWGNGRVRAPLPMIRHEVFVFRFTE